MINPRLANIVNVQGISITNRLALELGPKLAEECYVRVNDDGVLCVVTTSDNIAPIFSGIRRFSRKYCEVKVKVVERVPAMYVPLCVKHK